MRERAPDVRGAAAGADERSSLWHRERDAGGRKDGELQRDEARGVLDLARYRLAAPLVHAEEDCRKDADGIAPAGVAATSREQTDTYTTEARRDRCAAIAKVSASD